MPKLDIAASIPKVDMPVVAQQPSGGEHVVEADDKESEASEAPEAEPDETSEDGDSPGE